MPRTAGSTAPVVPGRLELPTSTLSVWRSNQLSYRTPCGGADKPPRDTLADSLVYVSHGTAAEGPRKADHEESGARTARIHGRRRAPGTPALSLFFFFSFLLTRRTHMKGATLQKGGVPAAPSGTATLLRLSPNHQFYPRPPLAVTDFRHPRLSWLDGRCVQGPGTYSPRHG